MNITAEFTKAGNLLANVLANQNPRKIYLNIIKCQQDPVFYMVRKLKLRKPAD